jgi:hypothetical protein
VIPSAHSRRLPCVATRLRSPYAASRWRSSASSFERRAFCSVRRAPSRSRSSPATSAGLRRRFDAARATLEAARGAHDCVWRGMPLLLEEVQEFLASGTLVVDACRHVVRDEMQVVTLATRLVLFGLGRALCEAWPRDVPRSPLVARAFRAQHAGKSHRAWLRVEIGRLRAELRPQARVSATKQGFELAPRRARKVVVLAPPVEEQHAGVLAFFADSESWSSSALAIALGASSRSVQRAFEYLAGAGKVQSFGRGRARRWITPRVPGTRSRGVERFARVSLRSFMVAPPVLGAARATLILESCM